MKRSYFNKEQLKHDNISIFRNTEGIETVHFGNINFFQAQKVPKVVYYRILKCVYETTMFRVDEIQTRQVIY